MDFMSAAAVHIQIDTIRAADIEVDIVYPDINVWIPVMYFGSAVYFYQYQLSFDW
jgi:hypothetical protein